MDERCLAAPHRYMLMHKHVFMHDKLNLDMLILLRKTVRSQMPIQCINICLCEASDFSQTAKS